MLETSNTTLSPLVQDVLLALLVGAALLWQRSRWQRSRWQRSRLRTRIAHLMEKLAVSDRTQAVTVALQRGLIHLSE
jgi:hypothetical protein